MSDPHDEAPSHDGERPCPFCAEMIKALAKKCRYCHAWIEGEPLPRPPVEDPLLAYVVPAGNLSSWAVAAGYLGLFAVLVFPAPVALVAGIAALGDIEKTGKSGRGRAYFGVVMGGLFSVALLVLVGAIIANG